MDAVTIRGALCAHLNGCGYDEIVDGYEMGHAQYWEALSYLDGWLACALGEGLPRTVMIRQLLRMWHIRSGLQPATLAFCEGRFGTRSIKALTDPQLRAALWTTVADWHAYWAQAQNELAGTSKLGPARL